MPTSGVYALLSLDGNVTEQPYEGSGTTEEHGACLAGVWESVDVGFGTWPGVIALASGGDGGWNWCWRSGSEGSGMGLRAGLFSKGEGGWAPMHGGNARGGGAESGTGRWGCKQGG